MIEELTKSIKDIKLTSSKVNIDGIEYSLQIPLKCLNEHCSPQDPCSFHITTYDKIWGINTEENYSLAFLCSTCTTICVEKKEGICINEHTCDTPCSFIHKNCTGDYQYDCQIVAFICPNKLNNI